MSLDPLETTVRSSREGLDSLASSVFVDGVIGSDVDIEKELKKAETLMDDLVNQSPLVAPLDVNDADENAKIFEKLKSDHRYTVEFWACLAGNFYAWSRQERSEENILKATWAAVCAERARMMVLFKQHLERVVFMGHSVRRLLDVLDVWKAHQGNADEEFWQITLAENAYVLSQVCAAPLVFIEEKAYVGGMTMDGKNARLVDYVFSVESSSEAMLVEIKTPVSRLLGPKYRGIYKPSTELAGAVVQVAKYRNELIGNLQSISKGLGKEIKAFDPRCVLIIGNLQAQLETDEKRESFELFRSNCKVEIITYDELFRKVEVLAEIFGLTKKSKSSS
ncbi:Shedu immune nuclease family protein [Stieleria mannarensis]|uniref:Shedu immune nuclease family protein n=1 Tax=Stieleria mannarensis TaxID=2755585 RepID=UPI0016006709|nr:Shedu immune nuclease family protein [Rhodopirellula sp. JC639]